MTAACGVSPTPSGPAPSPVITGVVVVPATVLLTVESRGGECLDGPCGSTISVDADGIVRAAAKPPNVLGTIPPAQLAALEAAIKLTDFTLLKSRPFTGECPTNFDGQEFIFEFAAPGGIERIATCEVDVDYAPAAVRGGLSGARPVHAVADDLTVARVAASASDRRRPVIGRADSSATAIAPMARITASATPAGETTPPSQPWATSSRAIVYVSVTGICE